MFIAFDADSNLYSNIKTFGGINQNSGFDIKCPYDIQIPAQPDGFPTIIDTKLRVRIMKGDVYIPFCIIPRSSIAHTPLMLANSIGLIDSGYQGHIKLAFRNNSPDPVCLKRGVSLVQIVSPFLSNVTVEIVPSTHEAFSNLTERGVNGFGSTGATLTTS